MNYKKLFEDYCKNYISERNLKKPEKSGEIEWKAKKPSELKAKIIEIDAHLTEHAEIILNQAREKGENNLSQEFDSIKRKYLMEFKEANTD